jgi:hypothetical protein
MLALHSGPGRTTVFCLLFSTFRVRMAATPPGMVSICRKAQGGQKLTVHGREGSHRDPSYKLIRLSLPPNFQVLKSYRTYSLTTLK